MKSRLYWVADHWAVRLADRLGVTLGRAKPLDLRGREVHPLEGFYRAERFQSVLFDVPVSKLRGLGSAAFPCTQEAGHPFIQTLLDYRDRKVQTYAGSALQRFYEHWQPQNAAEYLGVTKWQGCDTLQRLTPLQAVMPWSRLDPEVEYMKKVNAVRVASNRPHGKIRETEGRWHFFGPANASSGRHQFKRLLYLYHSIRDRGYRRTDSADGDIRGILMLNGDDWCVQIIGGGQHRASVLSALGEERVTVRLFYCLPNIVRRDETCYWPHVVNGLYSIEAALNLFERIFAGRPPWIGTTDSTTAAGLDDSCLGA